MRDAEAVRLVPQPLDQVQRRAVAVEQQRSSASGSTISSMRLPGRTS
jgi:hypothetical protein